MGFILKKKKKEEEEEKKKKKKKKKKEEEEKKDCNSSNSTKAFVVRGIPLRYMYEIQNAIHIKLQKHTSFFE